MLKLTFVAGARYAAWRDLDAWNESDIDRNASRFRSGVDVWIVQTYLHVRDALAADGWQVRLSDRFEPGSICVAHWDELHRPRWRSPLAYLIGVRADRPPVLVADKVVRQNTLAPDDAATVGIAPWPQPGMRARKPERGNRVQRVGYFGRMAQAPSFFADAAFRAELASLGLEFVPSEHDWQDYSDIDVVIAFRTAPPSLLRHKPVSKISNAWLAGVPAIVGPEPAYLQLRQSEHDMRVATDAPGVIAELTRLVNDEAFYAAMRARAAQRAQEFDVPALRDSWLEFFRGRVAPAFAQWSANGSSLLVRYPWYVKTMLAERFAAKRFRRQIRVEQAAMGSHASAEAAGMSMHDALTQSPLRPPIR
ncbi:MAG TPA: hypothetical protein VNG69_03700 [Casimicrobiaceae bacterium]|nr:hypothetical protein [Casimicrobiaceae bacterium]